jgi:hypothetical protein
VSLLADRRYACNARRGRLSRKRQLESVLEELDE